MVWGASRQGFFLNLDCYICQLLGKGGQEMIGEGSEDGMGILYLTFGTSGRYLDPSFVFLLFLNIDILTPSFYS